MGILAWILFGLAGAIAQLIMPCDDPGGGGFGGWLITVVVGVIGAIVGGFIAIALGFGGVTGFNVGSFLIAVLGALLVLAAWRMVAGRGRGGRLLHS